MLLCAILLPNSEILNYVIHILVATAGEVDEDGTVTHTLGQLHAVGHGVGRLNGGNDTLQPSQLVESVDGFFVVDDIVLDSADLLQEGF